MVLFFLFRLLAKSATDVADQSAYLQLVDAATIGETDVDADVDGRRYLFSNYYLLF